MSTADFDENVDFKINPTKTNAQAHAANPNWHREALEKLRLEAEMIKEAVWEISHVHDNRNPRFLEKDELMELLAKERYGSTQRFLGVETRKNIQKHHLQKTSTQKRAR